MWHWLHSYRVFRIYSYIAHWMWIGVLYVCKVKSSAHSMQLINFMEWGWCVSAVSRYMNTFSANINRFKTISEWSQSKLGGKNTNDPKREIKCRPIKSDKCTANINHRVLFIFYTSLVNDLRRYIAVRCITVWFDADKDFSRGQPRCAHDKRLWLWKKKDKKKSFSRSSGEEKLLGQSL